MRHKCSGQPGWAKKNQRRCKRAGRPIAKIPVPIGHGIASAVHAWTAELNGQWQRAGLWTGGDIKRMVGDGDRAGAGNGKGQCAVGAIGCQAGRKRTKIGVNVRGTLRRAGRPIAKIPVPIGHGIAGTVRAWTGELNGQRGL